MHSYPHMCRMDHVEIGHKDSEHEQCPLCRTIAFLEILLGHDERFQVAIGGNPIAVDRMLSAARRTFVDVGSPRGQA
jgi:hypothetical protein